MKKYVYLLSFLAGIAAIVTSPISYASKCGDTSPSVKRGIDPRTSIKPLNLKNDETKKINNIFNTLKGKWKGTAQISECIAKEGKDIMRTDNNLVELTVGLENQNSIEMEFEIRSPSKGTRKNIIEKLYIDQDFLMFNDGPFNFSASVLYLRENFVSYLRRTKLPGKGNIPIEFVRTLALYSRDTLTIEDIVYINGMLSSITLFEFKLQ